MNDRDSKWSIKITKDIRKIPIQNFTCIYTYLIMSRDGMIQHAQDTCVRFILYHYYESSKEPSEQRKYEDALAVLSITESQAHQSPVCPTTMVDVIM